MSQHPEMSLSECRKLGTLMVKGASLLSYGAKIFFNPLPGTFPRGEWTEDYPECPRDADPLEPRAPTTQSFDLLPGLVMGCISAVKILPRSALWYTPSGF